MLSFNMVTLIEHSQISPPPGIAQMSLPLTFFDVPWLYFPPTLHLRFYDFPTLSKSHFISAIVPKLKHSLSLTLQHFLPFAGNLILYPSTTSIPEIRYLKGDSVSVTFAECSKDFDYLTRNHARTANEFRDLVPQLASPVVTKDSSSTMVSILSIQVTLFPNQGISIGFSNLHVIGDASTTLNFIKAWSSVAKYGGDEPFLASGYLPFYNRDTINDPHSLATKCLNELGVPNFAVYTHHVSPNLVHATFIMTGDQIKQLKESTLIQLPKITHLSSFTVVCAYVWSCAAKVRAATRNSVEGDDQVECFICSADFRARLDPPLPPTYFGNCILPCIVISKIMDLVGEGGFLKAVELIGDGICRRLNSKNAVLEGMGEWIQSLCMREQAVGVAGSPKFNFYDTDFGWGKPKKYDVVSIDSTGSISLNADREFRRDVEIGLCFSQPEMDTFGNIFRSGLRWG